MQETWETRVRSLGQEDPLEEGMATKSSILLWRIPWTEEPGGLQSMGSRRVGHDWSALALHNPGNSHCICSCSSQLTNPWEVSYFTRMHFYGFFCLGKWMCNKWLRQWGNCLQCRRPRFDLWVRKIPWWKEWQPLQYSCLENPMDRGAWQAIVHGVAKSWRGLSD